MYRSGATTRPAGWQDRSVFAQASSPSDPTTVTSSVVRSPPRTGLRASSQVATSAALSGSSRDNSWPTTSSGRQRARSRLRRAPSVRQNGELLAHLPLRPRSLEPLRPRPLELLRSVPSPFLLVHRLQPGRDLLFPLRLASPCVSRGHKSDSAERLKSAPIGVEVTWASASRKSADPGLSKQLR
jgi:hypothetical protein